jgi:hypothetical protein
MAQEITGLAIPDSAMARAARAFIREVECDLLFNHSNRVFAFGALSGLLHGLAADLELLYVCALFHRVGLTKAYAGSLNRFEIDSANAACGFLKSYEVSEHAAHEVWDAIALHTTPGIGCHKSPLVALLTRGVEIDTLGFHLRDFSQEQRQQILHEFRRENRFKEQIIEALGAGMCHRPDSTFGTVNADVLDRVDPNYRRRNFCGLVLGSEWPD